MVKQFAPETPLVTAGPADEAEAFFIPRTENFADNQESMKWIDENLMPLIQQAESDGIPQREEWERIRNMLYLKHGAEQSYKGESDAYLPTYAKASDVRTSHINRALFPTDSVVDATSEDGQGDEEAVKRWMQYQLENQAKLRLNMKKHVRCLNDFGFAVSKVFWHKPPNPDKAVKLQKAGLALGNGTDGLYGTLSADCDEGVRFLPRDVFAFYVWPTTIDDLDQASLIFEVIQVSKQDAVLRFKSGQWKNEKEAGFPDRSDDSLTDLEQQAEHVTGNTQTSVASAAMGDLGTWGLVKECWLRMPVPRTLYGPGEVVGAPVPVKIVIINGTPVEACRNPFWHQKAPYVGGGLGTRPNQLYGTGLGRMGLELQGLINDTMNQTQDNVAYGLNPMAVINPTFLVGNNEVTIKPGGVINTTDPNSVKWDRPPVEQMSYGNQQLSTLTGFMNDLLGTPPIIQGTSAKGAAKTATGSQIMQSNVKTDMADVVEDLELSVLIPTMQMTYMLGQQYEKQERYIALTGEPPMRFTRDAFLGQFKFRWLASSQMENKQVRASQALQFLAQLVNPAVMQLLMQQGKVINPEPLLKLIYSTAVGGRDFDKIITPMPAAPPGMMPGMPGAPTGAMPGQPGMPPGAEEAPGGQPRSAVEQAPGGAPEGAAPGEAEDFMNVRQEADEYAAMLGAQGGYGDE